MSPGKRLSAVGQAQGVDVHRLRFSFQGLWPQVVEGEFRPGLSLDFLAHEHGTIQSAAKRFNAERDVDGVAERREVAARIRPDVAEYRVAAVNPAADAKRVIRIGRITQISDVRRALRESCWWGQVALIQAKSFMADSSGGSSCK